MQQVPIESRCNDNVMNNDSGKWSSAIFIGCYLDFFSAIFLFVSLTLPLSLSIYLFSYFPFERTINIKSLALEKSELCFAHFNQWLEHTTRERLQKKFGYSMLLCKCCAVDVKSIALFSFWFFLFFSTDIQHVSVFVWVCVCVCVQLNSVVFFSLFHWNG